LFGERTIFITGGAGFIASHICEVLIDKNKIIVFDNFQRDALRFTKIANHKNSQIINGNVLDFELLKDTMKNVDIVIHCAAVAGIYSVGKDSIETMKVNFLGTYHSLESSVINKVKRFIQFSTSEVYGPFVYKGKETDTTTLGPVGEKRWVYAASKLAAEHLAYTYEEKYGMDVVIVRPFNVYGPRQIGEGAIQQMILRSIKNEPITIYNDGTQIRAWCYIEDFVDALVACIDNENASGNIFNIGNPLGIVSIFELAEKIKSMTGSKSNVIFKNHPGPEVVIRVPDIDKASSILDYHPKINLDEGLRKTISWYKKHIG